MLIHDDIFAWEGFGGPLDLAAGRCRMRIIDLTKGRQQKVAHIKPILVVVSDLPDQVGVNKKMSVRSCASHVATRVTEAFNIDYHRMVYVEYYPASTYGDENQHHIPAKFDAVDFVWNNAKALHPKWRSLEAPLVDMVVKFIH